ncbi:hypothetical protein Efla_003525 [Eimeria flavescens]
MLMSYQVYEICTRGIEIPFLPLGVSCLAEEGLQPGPPPCWGVSLGPPRGPPNSKTQAQELPIHQKNYLGSLQLRLQRVEQLLKDETPAALGFSYEVDSSSSSSGGSTGLTRAQQHNLQMEQQMQELAAANPQQSQELLCRWQRAAQRNPDRQAGVVVPVVGLQGLAARIAGASQHTEAIAQAAAATCRDTEALTAKYNEMRAAVSLRCCSKHAEPHGSPDESFTRSPDESVEGSPDESVEGSLTSCESLERIKKRHAVLAHGLIRAIGLVEGLAVSRGVCEDNPRGEAANEQLMLRVQTEFQWADWQQRIDVLRVWLATLQQQKADSSSSSCSSETNHPVVAPGLLRLLTIQAETVEQLLQSLANTEAQIAHLEASVQAARSRGNPGVGLGSAASADVADTAEPSTTTAAAAAAAAGFPRLPAKVPLTVVGPRVALKVKVGGQDLLLSLDTCKEGLRLFAASTCSQLHNTPAASQQKHQKPQAHAQSVGREEEATPSDQQQQQQQQVQEQQHQQQQQQQLQEQHLQRLPTCYNPDRSSTAMWCLNWHEVCTSFSESPFTCRPSRQHDPKFAARYRQIVDGIVVSELRLEGLETVELELPSFSPQEDASFHQPLAANEVSDSLQLDSFPVKLILERDREFDAYKGLDGVWGIAGPDLCCREASLWNVILEPGVDAVGLDVNLPHSALESPRAPPSFLHLGTDPNKIFGEMLWAERMQTGAAGIDALLHFSTYDWQLCGQPISHALSNVWEAIVDLSSECMVLPPPMWRSLSAWLPVNATHELCTEADTDEDLSKSSVTHPVVLKGEDGETVYRRTCPLLSSSRRPLPAVSFSLSQSVIGSPRIELPLEQLVINEKGIGEVLCVVPQPFMSLGAEQWRQIRFGTRVLSALNVVLDRINWRLGLQKKQTQPSSDASCSAKPVCIGEQVYLPASNRCLDPDCSDKMLFEMNSETKLTAKSRPRIFFFLNPGAPQGVFFTTVYETSNVAL